jgi:exocyst complex component 2
MMLELEQAFGKSYEQEKEVSAVDEHACGVGSRAVQDLLRVMSELDKALFSGYIDVRSTHLVQQLRGGILDPSMDWYETPQPTEIRPYMLNTLVYLVRVHAQLSAAAPPLLERGLLTLVENVSGEALRSFKQVRRFGMGGMLRATLEIEFLQQTLGRFVSTAAGAALSDVYNQISRAYVKRETDENLQEHLDGVKKTLADARRATGVEFLCFRADKPAGASSSRDKEKRSDGHSTPRKKEGSSRSGASSGTRTPRRKEERPSNPNMI